MKARLPFSFYKVSGHSMEPAFKAGDLVLAFIYGSCKVGDAVLFHHHEKVYLKRITQIRGTQYYLSGDNQKDSLDSKDFGWVERSNLLGKVIKRFT